MGRISKTTAKKPKKAMGENLDKKIFDFSAASSVPLKAMISPLKMSNMENFDNTPAKRSMRKTTLMKREKFNEIGPTFGNTSSSSKKNSGTRKFQIKKLQAKSLNFHGSEIDNTIDKKSNEIDIKSNATKIVDSSSTVTDVHDDEQFTSKRKRKQELYTRDDFDVILKDPLNATCQIGNYDQAYQNPHYNLLSNKFCIDYNPNSATPPMSPFLYTSQMPDGPFKAVSKSPASLLKYNSPQMNTNNQFIYNAPSYNYAPMPEIKPKRKNKKSNAKIKAGTKMKSFTEAEWNEIMHHLNKNCKPGSGISHLQQLMTPPSCTATNESQLIHAPNIRKLSRTPANNEKITYEFVEAPKKISPLQIIIPADENIQINTDYLHVTDTKPDDNVVAIVNLDDGTCTSTYVKSSIEEVQIQAINMDSDILYLLDKEENKKVEAERNCVLLDENMISLPISIIEDIINGKLSDKNTIMSYVNANMESNETTIPVSISSIESLISENDVNFYDKRSENVYYISDNVTTDKLTKNNNIQGLTNNLSHVCDAVITSENTNIPNIMATANIIQDNVQILDNENTELSYLVDTSRSQDNTTILAKNEFIKDSYEISAGENIYISWIHENKNQEPTTIPGHNMPPGKISDRNFVAVADENVKLFYENEKGKNFDHLSTPIIENVVGENLENNIENHEDELVRDTIKILRDNLEKDLQSNEPFDNFVDAVLNSNL